MNVARTVVEILKREGVEFIVGYPVNPILEAAAEADMRPIIVRQERTGLHMADAFSRLNCGDRIGVFAMQFGPGTENAFGGVAQAYGESVPILVLPSGYPRHLTNVAPNFSAHLNFRGVTKLCEQLPSGALLSETMRRAFSQLRNGRPGPVLIEIPDDVFDEEVPGPLDYEAVVTTRSGPDPDAVAEVARVLSDARRPILYAGQGVHYARAWNELRELAELLTIPVATSLQGKSAFPENHPLSLGSGGRAMPRSVHRFLHDADVIFGIGCSFTRTSYGATIPTDTVIIHATLDPADLNKDVPARYALVGDAQLTLRALLAELGTGAHPQAIERDGTMQRELADMKQAWLEAWKPKLTSDEVPLSPYRVIRELMHAVDREQTIITHDAGSPRDQLSPFWEGIAPLTYMGWGMGAKLAEPAKLCINVWGDAAIGFTGMDIETAVRERIPILSILLNNSSMALEVPVMQVATEKYRSTDISGNYADLARALGAYGERVTEPGQIGAAILRGIQETQKGTPALLEFITAKEIEISSFEEEGS